MLDWLRKVNAIMERELLGGVETNRTELLPGPPQVLGQGNGMKDAEQNSKTSTPP